MFIDCGNKAIKMSLAVPLINATVHHECDVADLQDASVSWGAILPLAQNVGELDETLLSV